MCPPKKHEAAGSVHDRLVGHEALFEQCREARHERVLLRRGDAAPRDLERDPDGLRPRDLHELRRDVPDDAQVVVGGLRVRSRRIRDGIDVDAGYVARGPVRHELSGGGDRLVRDDERVVGVDRLQVVQGGDHARRWRPEVLRTRYVLRVVGLVDAFVGAEPGMVLDPGDDLVQELLVRGRSRPGEIRRLPEPEPAVDPVGVAGVHHVRRSLDLPRQPGARPVLDAEPHEVDAAGAEFLERVLAVSRLPAQRRGSDTPIGKSGVLSTFRTPVVATETTARAL